MNSAGQEHAGKTESPLNDNRNKSRSFVFTPVDIEEFYDTKAENDAKFSTDIIVLTAEESRLVKESLDTLKEISPETYEVLSNRISDIQRLAASIAQFPSLLQRQTLSKEIQTQHTLVESLLYQRDGDNMLHLPAKAVLGKGFLVAKFQTFSSIVRIARQSGFSEKLTSNLQTAVHTLMFTIMAEDVYMNLLQDHSIPVDIRRQIAYSLVILWEHRSDQNIADMAPVLAAVWEARRKLAPAFGTMVGTSELLLLSIEMDDQWRKFISEKMGITEVVTAMEEFLFGLSHEQIQKLKNMLKERGISAISRDEAAQFLGADFLHSHGDDPRNFFLLYSIRRQNANARKRMNIQGPHATLEDHYMRFILEQNKEKQYNDVYAR
ncbi:MAG: hypothetical protein NC041_07460 [Bacteroides sp.]|nr:hypothetical protein [Prevotella sp.]MCM1407136.1 hypothetical protein [Treponema brennaborense]MCM1470288.1 hypothetical protein [Bacteroides sp.]